VVGRCGGPYWEMYIEVFVVSGKGVEGVNSIDGDKNGCRRCLEMHACVRVCVRT